MTRGVQTAHDTCSLALSHPTGTPYPALPSTGVHRTRTGARAESPSASSTVIT